MAKQDTIKFLNEKVRNNGDASDYESIPFGADSDNIDRPDGSTAEENFVNIDNGVDIGRTLKYEDPYLYLLDGEGKELSRVTLVLPSHVHNYTIEEITKEATYTEAGIKTCTCACGDSHTEEIPMLVDSVSPTGTITVGENTYTSLVENPSFNIYFKTAQNVTIAGVDNESGVKSISYFVSDTKVDEAGLADVAWVAYESGFSIEPNRNAIVYAKITDNQDNVTYICSDGIVLDNIAPVFNGMEDGGTYGVGTTLTLQDGETLFVNGTEVELTDNTYTFNTEDNYLLSIKDRAGNQSQSITISIHTHNFVDGVCTICGEGLAPANELEKWDYTLDDATKKVTLNKYTGNDENVTVYSNYDVGGECYKTRIKSNDRQSSTNYMFASNKTVKNIVFKKGIDTSNVTNMSNMFCNCSSLTSLDISNFDTSKVTDMREMFFGCKSLTSLDLSNFDTSNVKYFRNTFEGCSSLTELNLSNSNTSNIRYIDCMFNGCSALTSLDLSHFDTKNVKNMECMFFNCKSLVSLDLSNFDTSNATKMSSMFYNCLVLTEIFVTNGKWKTEQANTTDMFTGCGVSQVTYKDAA